MDHDMLHGLGHEPWLETIRVCNGLYGIDLRWMMVTKHKTMVIEGRKHDRLTLVN